MKTIVSGIQSSGDLTLGNYLGAIKNFVKMQNALDPKETRYLYFIADLHAITVYQEPAKLKENIRKVAAIYLAAGLDPEKVILFIQSEVHEHAELGYLLETIAYIGELERMTQFKDKMAKQEKGVSSALNLSGFDGRGYSALQRRYRSGRRRPKTALGTGKESCGKIQQPLRRNIHDSRTANRCHRSQDNVASGTNQKDVQVRPDYQIIGIPA